VAPVCCSELCEQGRDSLSDEFLLSGRGGTAHFCQANTLLHGNSHEQSRVAVAILLDVVERFHRSVFLRLT
jgi:hypothetical protein